MHDYASPFILSPVTSLSVGYFLSMKATDDGYPFIILGYMVGPKVVMMGSLKPHTDVHGMFPTLVYAGIRKGPIITYTS